ncbi:hypothetical protein N9198_04650, partial [Akkermansiaceae bacterium]|nr:hypothetical protein [Akkermansiaceae bacterium]
MFKGSIQTLGLQFLECLKGFVGVTLRELLKSLGERLLLILKRLLRRRRFSTLSQFLSSILSRFSGSFGISLPCFTESLLSLLNCFWKSLSTSLLTILGVTQFVLRPLENIFLSFRKSVRNIIRISNAL